MSILKRKILPLFWNNHSPPLEELPSADIDMSSLMLFTKSRKDCAYHMTIR